MDDVLRRGGDVADLVAAWKTSDERRRRLQGELDALRAERNGANERMAKLDKKSPEFAQARDTLKDLSQRIKAGEVDEANVAEESRQLLMRIPNAPQAEVPTGVDGNDNRFMHAWGEKPSIANPKPHWEIGEALGILDFEAGVRITGSRFTVQRNGAARLTRALINFMIDLHTARGYVEVWPPAVVKRSSLLGTGQLPKFEDDLFALKPTDAGERVPDNDLFLSPTAEVQVTNLLNDQIVDAAVLPLKYTAYAPCFRAEAGAAGKDTRGLIRQHQFDKVELVKFVAPETSNAEHEEMREAAEAVLQALGLHYRVVTQCTGEMGFASAKTYDLEVWLPGQEAYREISSCSNCEDFQARRAKIRYRPAAGEKPRALHTLNGSGLAVGRTLVAILEQYQQPDGTVLVPERLRPYMGGEQRIA